MNFWDILVEVLYTIFISVLTLFMLIMAGFLFALIIDQ
jgi:hypothetical protein